MEQALRHRIENQAAPGQYRDGKAAIGEQRKFSGLLKMLRAGLT